MAASSISLIESAVSFLAMVVAFGGDSTGGETGGGGGGMTDERDSAQLGGA